MDGRPVAPRTAPNEWITSREARRHHGGQRPGNWQEDIVQALLPTLIFSFVLSFLFLFFQSPGGAFHLFRHLLDPSFPLLPPTLVSGLTGRFLKEFQQTLFPTSFEMHPGSTNPAPPSPPETHASYFGQVPLHHSAPHRPAMATPNSSFDMGSGLTPAAMETPTSRFRRGSSIGYISTPGHRELRERNGSVASKLLVIVVPPPSVGQEHGSLGHTLASGPPHRLSQGLIMPLLPTVRFP